MSDSDVTPIAGLMVPGGNQPDLILVLDTDGNTVIVDARLPDEFRIRFTSKNPEMAGRVFETMVLRRLGG